MTAVATPAFTSPLAPPRSRVHTQYLFEAPASGSDDTRVVSLTYIDDVPADMRARIETVVARVNELVRLPVGWNGGHAQRITALAALVAVEWLDRIAEPEVPAPHVVPLETGGIQLEWVAAGQAFEIEIGPDGSVAVLGVDGAGNVVVDAELGRSQSAAPLADSRKFLTVMFDNLQPSTER